MYTGSEMGRKSEGCLALWARVGEKIGRLALIHAISSNPSDPVIGRESVCWARELAFHSTKRMLYQADVYTYENEFDRLRQKAKQKMREKGGEVSFRTLLRMMHVEKGELEKIVNTMLESGELVAVPGKHKAIVLKLL